MLINCWSCLLHSSLGVFYHWYFLTCSMYKNANKMLNAASMAGKALDTASIWTSASVGYLRPSAREHWFELKMSRRVSETRRFKVFVLETKLIKLWRVVSAHSKTQRSYVLVLLRTAVRNLLLQFAAMEMWNVHLHIKDLWLLQFVALGLNDCMKLCQAFRIDS